MGFLDIFKQKKTVTYNRWKELGNYNASFSNFGSDAYKSELVRSCVRPLADFTSKANCKCGDSQLERLINNRPNLYMSGSDFLRKVRTMLELTNTVFIYLERDDRNKVSSLYPIPYASYEGVEYNGRLFVRFTFLGDAARQLVLAWDDLAVIRKDYNKYDIGGDSADAILPALQRLTTTNEGLSHAVKATANLRGLLKSTKGMLAESDIKKMRDAFVADYLNLENAGGIAALDGTMDFIPINMNPTIASAEQMKQFREDIYRYYGVNDDIVMGNMNDDKIEAFYELKIEPFLIALSKELYSKIYSGKRDAFDSNYLIFEANKMQFASLEKKIKVFKEVVLYGGMTINEWREGCNMAPIDGGDVPIRRLDADVVTDNQKDEEVTSDED